MAGLGYYAPLKTDDSVPNSNEPDDATVTRKESAPSTSTTMIAKRKFLLGLGLLAGTAALFAFYPTSTFNSHSSGNVLQTEENEQLAQCPSMLPLPASPPAPINVWASLTVEESVDVYSTC
jgi:primary-amine oxidase